jgi:FkbM family methyltransferase
MLKFFKKFFRTIIVLFPFLRGWIVSAKRVTRLLNQSSVEEDFNVIDYFPKNQELLFLDIGGNWGFIIDVMLRKHKACKIYSFEPNPELHNYTKKNFGKNPRVKLYNFGLGEQAGSFHLYVPVYHGYMFDGLGSLSPEFNDEWLSSTLFFYNKKNLVLKEIVCEVRYLDELNLHPFFIKIDVEGAELSVIRGGQKTIATAHPVILMESGETDEEVLNLLSNMGYKMYRYDKSRFIEGQGGSPNTFFMTDDKYHLILEGMKS